MIFNQVLTDYISIYNRLWIWFCKDLIESFINCLHLVTIHWDVIQSLIHCLTTLLWITLHPYPTATNQEKNPQLYYPATKSTLFCFYQFLFLWSIHNQFYTLDIYKGISRVFCFKIFWLAHAWFLLNIT